MMIRMRPSHLAACIVCAALLAGCGTAPPPAAVTELPPTHGTYKVGNPYQIDGRWYYPAENPNYDETGIASWYGPNFHEKYTANGEIFDQNALTAAHRTLPMPSIVEVENLENGRTIQVRVNDRGPFVGDRIIDMSRRSAQLLGFDREGTAKVRVRYLLGPSIAAQAVARSGEEIASDDLPQTAPSAAVVAEALPDMTPSATGPSSSPYVPPPSGYHPQYLQPAGIVPALPERVTYRPVRPSQIYIQAGAFTMGPNAFRMKARLDSLGPVSVTGVVVNGLSIYRVRLGPVATVDQADQLLSQARAAGATDAKIVVN
jgi:rare lipoprotein A